jgi:hypothetical protein
MSPLCGLIDRMPGLLMDRADALMGCTAPRTAQRRPLWPPLIDVFEAQRTPEVAVGEGTG